MKKYLIILILALLAGCAKPPPPKTDNLCQIFTQYPHWYWAVQNTQKKWGIPIPITMAVMYQESRFTARAKPPRQKLLGVIPWFRPTSAFGYAQSINDSWRGYQRSTGHTGANRDNFNDAVDFMGWYINLAHQKVGLPKSDAYRVYLVYHEGIGGYSRGTANKKAWLLAVAKKVSRHAIVYQNQLARCENSLPQKPWWYLG